MGLTRHVRHLCIDVKIIIQVIILVLILRIDHRHGDLEGSVVGCCQRTLCNLRRISASPPEPAETFVARDGIFNLGVLHGHACISRRHTAQTDGVASLILVFVFVKRHLECRTLVFLYTETSRDTAVIARRPHFHGEVACQTLRGQREIDGSCSKIVGCRVFIRHFLVVGIIEREGQ